MVISQPGFAAQGMSQTGKVWKFDSVEDLAAFTLNADDLQRLWVADYEGQHEFIPVGEALFLVSENIRSPMGLGIAAFASEEARTRTAAEHASLKLTWPEVVDYVASQWPDGRPIRGTMRPTPRHQVAGSVATQAAGMLRVGVGERFKGVAAAVAAAPPGATVLVRAGEYREPERIVVSKSLTLLGEAGAVLDGSAAGVILEIRADSVTVRGLTFRNVAPSHVEDRAAIMVDQARYCRIENNVLENTFFGIYLANSGDCTVANNRLHASNQRETASGNGIHLWYSKNVVIVGNQIRGHRDGIYFEFVEDSRVEDNVSEANLRYGLHFMFSDGCHYQNNEFRANGAGVAVMYAEDVTMIGNQFVDNWGPASFGLLIKDIVDSRLERNRFAGNSVGLFAEGANRVAITHNEFRENGWAVKIMADSEDSEFTGNNFVANSFDLTTNSRRTWSEFDGNYWDEYGGYDLDADGVGDVPFHPVRLFALLVERNEPTLVLLRSLMASLLDLMEAMLPVLTPETLRDDRPAMRPFDNGWGDA